MFKGLVEKIANRGAKRSGQNEFVAIATEKIAAINEAYGQIVKERAN